MTAPAVPSHSFTCDLTWDSTYGGTYETVGHIQEIHPPKMKANEVKTTNLKVTSAFHTYIAGFIDAGECSFKMDFDKTQSGLLNTAFIGRALSSWKVTASDLGSTASTIVFDGFIKELQMFDVPEDDRLTGDITVKVSGKPIFTAGT